MEQTIDRQTDKHMMDGQMEDQTDGQKRCRLQRCLFTVSLSGQDLAFRQAFAIMFEKHSRLSPPTQG